MLGEATLLLLREHEPPVDEHVELALSARRHGGRDPQRLDLARETRGARVVAASGGAVEDLDGHAASLPEAARATGSVRMALRAASNDVVKNGS